MSIRTVLHKFLTVWRTVLRLGFFVLCIRFHAATFRENYPDIWAQMVLATGALVLGLWNPRSALLAFTIFVPLLPGFGLIQFVGNVAPMTLLFSSLWIGSCLRQSCRRKSKSEVDQVANNPNRYLISVINILITFVLLSVGRQIWTHGNDLGFFPTLVSQSIWGYSSAFYFLTSGFIWLQGLFYCEHLLIFAECKDVLNLSKMIFAISILTLGLFTLLQIGLDIPERASTNGLQSPYEDISSFGSIAVSSLAFCAALVSKERGYRSTITILGVIASLVMVVASWSRAAWLACGVFTLLIAAIRLPKKWNICLALLLAAGLSIINANANNKSWLRHDYLVRLIALVRWENPTNKSMDRINLYRKAYEMIKERLISGHGIGSFYSGSTKYALKEDAFGEIPNFAHNALLQTTAEMGIPFVLLLCGLTALAAVHGVRRWLSCRSNRKSGGSLSLALALAMGAYSQTQMTANSLNIYVSNQYFFWFLVGSLLCMMTAWRRPNPPLSS